MFELRCDLVCPVETIANGLCRPRLADIALDELLEFVANRFRLLRSNDLGTHRFQRLAVFEKFENRLKNLFGFGLRLLHRPQTL